MCDPCMHAHTHGANYNLPLASCAGDNSPAGDYNKSFTKEGVTLPCGSYSWVL